MRLLALLLLLLVPACRPDAYSYESNTSGEEWEEEQNQSNSASGPLGQALPNAPTVVAPHMVLGEIRSEVEIYVDGLLEQALRETLVADGTGNFALSLESTSQGGGVWTVATQAQVFLHEQRQHFLTLYRGPVQRDASLAFRNYEWRPVRGSFSVAGRPVVRYHLSSRYGIGDIELDLDPQSDLLLAWTYYDPTGQPVLRQTSLSFDENPDLSNVQWASSNVPTSDYDGQGANGSLGFDPLELIGSGPGFEGSSEKVLQAGSVIAGMGNLHVNFLHDGLRSVAIVQEETDKYETVGPHQVKALSMREAADTGVSVLEGKLESKWVHAVGPIPRQDLLMLLSTLRE